MGQIEVCHDHDPDRTHRLPGGACAGVLSIEDENWLMDLDEGMLKRIEFLQPILFS